MPTPIDVVNQFMALFDGNRDAVGTEEGGCRRLKDPSDWELELEGHLRHPNCQVGVYPMTTMIDDDWTTIGSTDGPYSWVVKWGCVDYDEGDEISWKHAVDLHRCLAQFNIYSWIERSRSKGYHVWVFLEEWTEAWLVRRALLAASQIVGTPTKEINPKQTELQPGQLGNYVRLPYPGALAAPDAIAGLVFPRRVIVSPGKGGAHVHSLPWFVDVATGTLAGQGELEKLAWYYIAPEGRQSNVSTRDWGDACAGPAVDRLRGKARIIYEQGPLENPDSPTNYRGQTLWKLARYIVEDDKHSPEEALELLRDADRRWGKFHERHDCDQRLRELVDKAFGTSS